MSLVAAVVIVALIVGAAWAKGVLDAPQARVLCVEHRRAPGRREVAAALGCASTNTVNDHMRALVKKGYLDPGPEAKPNNAWPCRDLDGTPIRWTLSYTREVSCPPST